MSYLLIHFIYHTFGYTDKYLNPLSQNKITTEKKDGAQVGWRVGREKRKGESKKGKGKEKRVMH